MMRLLKIPILFIVSCIQCSWFTPQRQVCETLDKFETSEYIRSLLQADGV